MGVIPCAVFGVVALNYSVLILNKLDLANIRELTITQGIVFVIVTIFCIFVKANLLTRELEQNIKNSIEYE